MPEPQQPTPVRQAIQDLQAAKERYTGVVQPAVDEITLLGRYRATMVKLAKSLIFNKAQRNKLQMEARTMGEALAIRHPDRVTKVGAFGSRRAGINPDTVPDIQREVAERAGIALPDIERRDLTTAEEVAGAAAEQAKTQVLEAQREVVQRVVALLGDDAKAAELERGLAAKDPEWTLPSGIAAAALARESGTAGPEAPGISGRGLPMSGPDHGNSAGSLP